MPLARPLLHNVSVVGGRYLQAREIRDTSDIDVVVKSGPEINRFAIRDMIAKADSRFTVNPEGKCGLTFREKASDPVVSFDIIDDTVTLYMPEGMTPDEVVAKDVAPLPTDSEAVAMKLLAGSDRLKSCTDKAVKDLDDAMLLFREMHRVGDEIAYKDEKEKTIVSMAFNAFYPTYKSVKDERKEFCRTEEWKAFLKID